MKEALELLTTLQEKEKKELKEAQDLQARVKDDIASLIGSIDGRGTQIKILEEMFK